MQLLWKHNNITLKAIAFLSDIIYKRSWFSFFISAVGRGDIVLKDARHPCLEMQDDVAFIANSVTLIRGQSGMQPTAF